MKIQVPGAVCKVSCPNVVDGVICGATMVRSGEHYSCQKCGYFM